jgi:hypothetical protein
LAIAAEEATYWFGAVRKAVLPSSSEPVRKRRVEPALVHETRAALEPVREAFQEGAPQRLADLLKQRPKHLARRGRVHLRRLKSQH